MDRRAASGVSRYAGDPDDDDCAPARRARCRAFRLAPDPVAIFWVTSLVEGIGVSQIFAFLPSTSRRWACPEPDRLRFVGLFGALIFVVGVPLVPLWGVWADKYSRKAVIVRSALVEAVVFAAVALEPRAVAARR